MGYFNAKLGREDIFKPTFGNESLHEISTDNGVRSAGGRSSIRNLRTRYAVVTGTYLT
jgi:hypothetical protein